MNVSVSGKVIGYSGVKIAVRDPKSPDNTTLFTNCQSGFQSCKFVVVSFFVPSTADEIYDIVTIIFTVLCQFDIGLRTRWLHVNTMLKNPLPAILGLGCHYILMPLLAFAMSRIIDLESPQLALGFFLTGIVSGGGLSNLHTQVLGGNFPLSTLMTYISLPLALAFSPMWLAIFGPLLVPEGMTVTIPFDNIVISILEFLIPAIAGFIFRHFFPKYGHFIEKFITLPIVGIMFLYYCTYGLYTYQWMFQLFTVPIVLCGCLLPYIAFFLSGLIALAARQPYEMVITIMMETAFQNVGLALSIVRLSIADPIVSVLSLVGPYSVLIFSQVPVVAAEIIVIIATRVIPRVKERRAAKGGKHRLSEEESIDDAPHGALSYATSQPVTGSQFDNFSEGLVSDDETKRFFNRQADYFGKQLEN